MEQFPLYRQENCEWEEWKQNNVIVPINEQSTDHCVQHCEHTVCRNVRSKNKRRNIEPQSCTCEQLAILEKITFDQERISQLRLQDILAAQTAYKSAAYDETVTVELGPATALVEKMRTMGCLDLQKYLRASRDFTARTVRFNAQYSAATRSANDFISKLIIYLSTTLAPLLHQSRSIATKDFVNEMQEAMRLEIFWWVSEWCLPNKVRRADDSVTRALNLKRGFYVARKAWIRGTSSKGVKVLVERMDRTVELVIAVLLWWDTRMEKEKACEENKEPGVSEEEVGSAEGVLGMIWTGSESGGSEGSGESV
jgi:hypothetical protein